MLHHERVIPPPHIYPADEWNIVEKQYTPEFLERGETIFATSNGYLGMRGAFEEGVPTEQEGTFINGFYESWPIVYGEEAFGFARTGQTIVNVTNSKVIKLFVDDEPFWLSKATVLRYDRRLNMKTGTLDREILWKTPAGKQVLITSKRLASFEHRHVAMISYQVTVLDADAPVVIASEMHANQPASKKSGDDPRKARALGGKVLHSKIAYANNCRIVLCHETGRSKMVLACAMDHGLDTECSYASQAIQREDFGQVAFTIQARAGVPIHLTKYIVYHTSETASPHEVCGRAEWTMDRIVVQGFAPLLASQERIMEEFWRRSDVQIHDLDPARVKRTTAEIQQAIRFNLFHVFQASARSDDAGIPAKGLTGQAYEGQYFWDTEIYVLPFLIYTSPHIARNLLAFRYRMLDKARARARELNMRGAMYPWRTINGDEASAYYAAGTAQYHINADIAYALRKYVNATGDEEFLLDCGAEMLIETARLWMDLGFYSERKGGKFCINGVTGPDEYNTVVNNNAYTNLMARENLRYAAETVESIRNAHPEVFNRLTHKTTLALTEIEDWKHAAANMYVPYDERTGIYPQDDSFLDREPWEFARTPEDHYPLLLYYHPLNIYRHQVIKQTDVMLAMFLLDHEFPLEVKRRNFKFYDPLTTGDSSLSSCIEAIIAAEIGDIEKFTQYARAAQLMDLDDVGGNVKDGCHIASMGGAWMILTYGVAGLRDYDGMLSFSPRRVPDARWKLRFPLAYRGQLLDVNIDRDGATYFLREGTEVVIRHEGEELKLTRDDPRAIRPISHLQT